MSTSIFLAFLCIGILFIFIGRMIKSQAYGFIIIGLAAIVFIIAGIYYGEASSIGKPLLAKNLPEGKDYWVVGKSHGYLIVRDEYWKDVRMIFAPKSKELEPYQSCFKVKNKEIVVVPISIPEPGEF